MNVIHWISSKLDSFSDWQIHKVMDKAEKLHLIPDKRSYIVSKYNAEVIFFNLYKILAIMILSLLLHKLDYFLILFITCIIMQTFSHGIHFNNDLSCFLATSLNYFGGIYLSIGLEQMIDWNYFNFSKIILITSFIFFFCFMFFFLYAPASTQKRPIKPLERKRKKKYALIGLSVCYMFSFILFSVNKYHYALLIIWETIFQTISILPVTFKIFKIKQT